MGRSQRTTPADRAGDRARDLPDPEGRYSDEVLPSPRRYPRDGAAPGHRCPCHRCLFVPIPITMDYLRSGPAWELPRCFGAVADGDDPDGTNVRWQAQHFLHFAVVERPDETGTQALVYHRKQDKHRDEGSVDDAEETDTPLPVPSCRPSYVRDDDDDQRGSGDEHLLERGPRQVLFRLLVAHHDEFLRFRMSGRRIAGG